MRKNELIDKLTSFYTHIQYHVKRENYDLIIDELFDGSDLDAYLSEIHEELRKEYYILKNTECESKEIFSYHDQYDFINTLSNIDYNDLFIFFDDKILLKYTFDLINVINKALGGWTLVKNKGFRKGTKIYLEMEENSIKLYAKLDMKF